MENLGIKAINNRAKKIKEIEAQIKVLEAEADAIKAELKADLESKELDEVVTADYTIRYKVVVSSRFDTTTFKKEFADLYNRYTKSSESKRFTIN